LAGLEDGPNLRISKTTLLLTRAAGSLQKWHSSGFGSGVLGFHEWLRLRSSLFSWLRLQLRLRFVFIQ